MTAAEKALREGSASKRADILSAARDLFLRDGFERTSMDAISAEAGVSKRTVYDYYGTKANLLATVVEAAAEALFEGLRASLDTHLAVDAPIETTNDLEDALTAFAVELATTLVGSSNYTTVFALTSGLRTETVPLDRYLASTTPEEVIAERLGHFASRGLLDLTNAKEAADHFTALTLLLAYSHQPNPAQADFEHVRATVRGGVRAFMRAYGTDRPST